MKTCVVRIVAVLATVCLSLPARAAVIDFAGMADQALPTGDTSFAGFPATVLSNGTPYITSGLGLGICDNVDVNGVCTSSTTDAAFEENGGAEDILQLNFDNPVDITGLSFVDVNGNSLNDSSALVAYDIRLEDGTRFAGVFGDKSFTDFVSLALSGSLTSVVVAHIFHGGSDSGLPFFISSIDISDPAAVPLPAALPLFLMGIAGLGFKVRRRTSHR